MKRNVATGGPGYSWPSASGQEVWKHHVPATAKPDKLEDLRLARFLKVDAGSEIMVRHRVTGPEDEPPFQISNSWIHPRVADIPGVAVTVPGPISDWVTASRRQATDRCHGWNTTAPDCRPAARQPSCRFPSPCP